MAFMIQVAMAVFVNHQMHSLLIARGFDLLISRNAATLRQFSLRITQLKASATNCTPGSAKFLEDLRSSSRFKRQKIIPAEASSGPIQIDPESGIFSVVVSCIPGNGASTRIDLDSRWLSNLFTDRSGLGDSGETYFMTSHGVLLTESRFLNNPRPAPVPPKFDQHWMGQKNDYRGIPVLAVWDAAYLGEVKGIIASEIDVAEVLKPAEHLAKYLLAFLAIASALSVAFAHFLARNLSWRADEYAAIQKARNHALIEGQEQERMRIGLELHDDIGQEIAALSWRIAGTGKPASSDDIRLVSIQRIAGKIRSLSSGLLTSVVSADGLESSLRQLVQENQDRAKSKGLKLDLALDDRECRFAALKPEFKVGIYRIAQEGIHNMLKHSTATYGRVILQVHENGDLNLVIEDNGQGLTNQLATGDRKEKALGLNTIQIRTESLKGKVLLQPSPELGGLQINVRFNVNEAFT